MTEPTCDLRISEKCEGKLRHFGAILFSPPKEKHDVKKWHVCVECYKEIAKMKKLMDKALGEEE